MKLIDGRFAMIAGTGKYIPERVMKNSDFEKFLDTNDKWIVERTGIKERHLAGEDEKCSDLAFNAAVFALKDSGLAPEELDMVIVGTCSPDSAFPSVASKVQGRLGAVNAGAFDVHAGCTGSLAAMSAGIAGIACGMWDNVLVIGAEVFRDILDWTDRGTCILFGDGAGACVLSVSSEKKGRFTASKLMSDGTKHNYITLEGENRDDPHKVRMKGNDVFRFVNTALPVFIKDFCQDAGLTPNQVDFWVLHQANTRIIEGVFKRIGVSTEKTLINLENYGNTSAASMMITLDEAMKSGRIRSGEKVAFVAFGAGMTLGALLYEA
ncbi:MAG: ketoacyl-ACP synthase III [Synergistaceae bacterium]|nr:ketoacyl-ACP synthase III [Synergistaceae bacterium]